MVALFGLKLGADAWSRRFKGVSFARGKWRARIMIKGKVYVLGSYLTQEDAARAYDEALVYQASTAASIL